MKGEKFVRRMYWIGAALAAILFALAGCSATATDTSTQATPVTSGSGETADVIAGRPAAPAAEDADFRPDPVSVVAATGRPQLIEFFAFW